MLHVFLSIRAPALWFGRASRPSSRAVERFLVAGAGLGGEDEHRQPGVGGDVQALEVEVELTDDRVVEVLEAR